MRHSRERRLVSGLVAAAMGGTLLVVVLASGASAVSATFFVRSNGDGLTNPANCPANNLAGSTNCRLRDAMAAASANPGDDTILADAGLATITLTADLMYTDANKETIQGQGATNLVIDGASAFGGPTNNGAGAIQIDHVTIQNTATTANGAPTVGAIGTFGGGAVTVNNSTLTHNTGTNTGGGQGVGAILVGASSPLVIANSTLDHNTGSSTGAVGVGGVLLSGNVTITNSTFNANTGTGGPAGFGALGSQTTATATNSTFTANTATGTAVSIGGINANVVHLAYDTVVGNSGVDASNVSGTTVAAFGTVVTGGITGPNCSATTFNSAGYNFEDTNTCAFSATGDHHGAGSPGLGALANNGGPTQTMLPQTGSPLIDAIPNSACQTAPLASGITTDQRGFARPRPAAGACDIGAVEIQPAAGAAPIVTVTPRFTG